MDSRMGTSRSTASASACGVHCCHCTGLSACWRRYGLMASPRAFFVGESSGLTVGSLRSWRPIPLLCGFVRVGFVLLGFVKELADCVRAVVGGLIGLRMLGIEGFGHLFQLPVHRTQ